MNLNKHSEQGRSMVEMLGTLAIMGALSVGAIGGYSYAMNKHRTNELIYEATKRAQWVGTQLEMNKNAQNIGFGGFGTDEFGGGKFTGTVKTDLANPNQFGIVVSALREAVCENIVKGLETETNGVIRAVKTTDGTSDFDRDNCDENAEFLLVFNRDLSTTDTTATTTNEPTPDEPEEPTPPMTTAAALSGDAECSYHGTWYNDECACNVGWGGIDCSTENPCSNHGSWYNSSWCGSYCNCDIGWGSSNCSVEKPCGDHGQWKNGDEEGCSCDNGWGGSNCSLSEREGYCNNHGDWNGWYCTCDYGWGDNNCSKCSGHGNWCGSNCDCHSGWTGADCSTPN